MLNKFAVIDVETTGGSSDNDYVIEIGIVLGEDGKVTNNYQTLVNPQKRISPYIEAYTGISSEELETAPTFDDIKDELYEMLYDRVFVAHNARFDYSFIKNEFRRHDIKFNAKQLCTVKLSRILYPRHKHHNLDSLIDRFGLNCEQRHRALPDAQATWEFLNYVTVNTPTEVLENTINKILKTSYIPININPELINDIPEQSGVYIFYGDEDIPLYVGKSINLKDRILSHFANDTSSSTELKISQQLKNIKTINTAGELGALLKESELIKQMKPLYNRVLRESRVLTVLRKNINENGFYTVAIDTADNISPEEFPNILGVFKNNKSAKDALLSLCTENSLCQKLLGLEKTDSYCFAYHLGTCNGACANEEETIAYNLRFIKAFEKLKLKTWPFTGPVVITEKNQDISEQMVFNNWCLIGYVDEFGSFNLNHEQGNFDYHTYQILRRYFKNAKKCDYKVLPADFEFQIS